MASQITSEGGASQGKSGPITIESLLGDGIGPVAPEPAAVYFHVPFCFHKCHYCDFYSVVDRRDRQGRFVYRMTEELTSAAKYLPNSIETVFVGGGTPTLLLARLWDDLLAGVNRCIPLAGDVEFTVEANPETVTDELIAVLDSGGVNRLSIGAQSFDPRLLKALERWHEPESVASSVEIARAGGIENINLDLIFAIPGQTLADWAADLDRALALDPDHLSCYGLTYEPNTPLTVKMKAGQVRPAGQELEAEMYELAIDRLAAAGFEHYEISNWAKSGRRCRHNMIYWTNRQWWPLGPSASGHAGGWRWKNVPRLEEYLDHGPLPRIVDAERLDEDGRAGEAFMLGLRLVEGIELSRVDGLLSLGTRGNERATAIERCIDDDLLERAHDHLRLTRRGLLLADGVVCELV